MTVLGLCYFCGGAVTDTSAARPVRGWEPLRSQGGANRIIDRRHSDDYVAHVLCCEKAGRDHRAGISPDQEALL